MGYTNGSLANIKCWKSDTGKGIAKLKRCEQKMVYGNKALNMIQMPHKHIVCHIDFAQRVVLAIKCLSMLTYRNRQVLYLYLLYADFM